MDNLGISLTGEEARAWKRLDADDAAGRIMRRFAAIEAAAEFDKACHDDVTEALEFLQSNPDDVYTRHFLSIGLQKMQHGLHGNEEACRDVQGLREMFKEFLEDFPL